MGEQPRLDAAERCCLLIGKLNLQIFYIDHGQVNLKDVAKLIT
jgi:hypothetical protein